MWWYGLLLGRMGDIPTSEAHPTVCYAGKSYPERAVDNSLDPNWESENGSNQ